MENHMTTKSFESVIEFTLRFCHQIESKSYADAEMWFDDLNHDDLMNILKEKNLNDTIESEIEIQSVEEMF